MSSNDKYFLQVEKNPTDESHEESDEDEYEVILPNGQVYICTEEEARDIEEKLSKNFIIEKTETNNGYEIITEYLPSSECLNLPEEIAKDIYKKDKYHKCFVPSCNNLHCVKPKPNLFERIFLPFSKKIKEYKKSLKDFEELLVKRLNGEIPHTTFLCQKCKEAYDE